MVFYLTFNSLIQQSNEEMLNIANQGNADQNGNEISHSCQNGYRQEDHT